jgi:hypothetical protein
MLFKSYLRLGAASTFLAASSYLAFATPASVNASLQTVGHLRGSLATQACSNNPGPFITLDGDLVLGGIDAVLIFKNNLRGTHTREETVSVRVSLAPDRVITLHKQPPLGGVGGNPWIFMQLCDSNNNPVTDRVLLGRCVQGLLPVSFDFPQLANVFAQIAGSCSNSPGPFITLDGNITLGGINAKLIFSNSRQPNAPHQNTQDVELNISLVESGGVIQFAKQPPLGGVGGNPHVFVRFESGGVSSSEIYLGRCVQLSR